MAISPRPESEWDDNTKALDNLYHAGFDQSLINLDWQNSILNIISDPVVNPFDGARYIIGSNPSGDWVDHEHDIVEYSNGEWYFITPNIGFTVYRESDNSSYVFDGSVWAIQNGSGSGGLPTNFQERLDLEAEYKYTLSTAYKELTYSGDNITRVDVWSTPGKTTKLFTKIITYTNNIISTITLTDEQTSNTLTKTLTYVGGRISVIEEAFV